MSPPTARSDCTSERAVRPFGSMSLVIEPIPCQAAEQLPGSNDKGQSEYLDLRVALDRQ